MDTKITTLFQANRSVSKRSLVLGSTFLPILVAVAIFLTVPFNQKPFSASHAIFAEAFLAENPDADLPEGYPLLEKENHMVYLSGYTDRTVRPDDNITRAEVSAIFRNLILDEEKEAQRDSNFSDVPEGIWFTQAIAYLESLDIISGYSDGTFLPNHPITRAEFTAIASKFDDLDTGEHPFPDVPATYWGSKFIVDCYKKGWISGYPDGNFYPDKAISRGEVVSFINNMLERKVQKTDLPEDVNPFLDLQLEHWAYAAIIEASCAHNYVKAEDGYEKWTDDDEVIGDGRVFYISESQGSDDNNGESEETPWQSLDRVSKERFQPGDRILFRRGDQWTGRVQFYGSGEADNRITVAAYGDEKNGIPAIHGEGIDPERTLYNDPVYSAFSGTVELFEGSYWTISQLEVTNQLPGDTAYRVGIMAIDDCRESGAFRTTPSFGLIIRDCYVHDVVSTNANKYSGGIVLLGNWNDVLIDNNVVRNVAVTGIRNVPWGPASSLNEDTNLYHENFIISNNRLEDIYGDCIALCNIDNVLMEYNYVNGFCQTTQKNYAALWTWASKDVVIQYNEITGGGNPPEDGAPFDVDWYNINTLIQYNYTHDNGNNVAMFTRNTRNTVFRHNLSINDVRTPERTSMFYYEPAQWENAPLLYDNIIYQANGLPTRSIFDNFVGIEEIYLKFFNNMVISASEVRLSSDAILSKGRMGGNIFIPKSIFKNASEVLAEDVLMENNSILERNDLKLAEIAVGEAPKDIIRYNRFDTEPLEDIFGDLSALFHAPDELVPPADISEWEKDQGVEPSRTDFFGRPTIAEDH